MGYVISKNAIDTQSIQSPIPCCIYNAKALEGEVIISPNVFFEGQPVEFYQNLSKLSDVECTRTPLEAPPCTEALTQPAKRVILTTNNINVCINNKLFAIQGDVTQLISVGGSSTNRPIQGPFKYLSIQINSKPLV